MKTTAYNTYLQAIGRAFHYHPTGQNIRMYCDPDVIQLCAGEIDYIEYVNRGGKLSSRIKRGSVSGMVKVIQLSSMKDVNNWKMSLCLKMGKQFYPSKLMRKRDADGYQMVYSNDEWKKMNLKDIIVSKEGLGKESWFKVSPCYGNNDELVYVAKAYLDVSDDCTAHTHEESMYY